MISVIVTAYNRDKFVINALGSLLKQNFHRDSYEIILVTNLKSPPVHNFCIQNGIRIIYYEGTLGEFLAKGVNETKGDIITFLDDDDEWEPEKLSTIRDIFERHPEVYYIHNGYITINEEGELIKGKLMTDPFGYQNKSEGVTLNGSPDEIGLRRLFYTKADFNLSCISIRKSLFTEELLSALNGIESNPDGFFFFSSLFRKVRLYVSSHPLTRYRVHSVNISKSADFLSKGKEIERELKTLLMLERIFADQSGETPELALKMMIEEYDLLRMIYLKQYTRRDVIMRILNLLKLPHAVANPLKMRVVAFSLLALINPELPEKAYKTITMKSFGI